MTKKIILFLAVFASTHIFAQSKIKIDGVAVVVGENIVLDSDVTKYAEELKQKSEGKVNMSDCEMLEEIMLIKLLAHHAVVDSVVVSDAEIESNVERNIGYFTQQLGSIEKVVDLYGFDDEDDLRKELSKIEKESALVRGEKENTLKDVEVTPEEVRVYFKSLEASENLPEFGTEIEMAQIVMHAKPSEDEVQETLDKLKEIRQDIVNGSSIRMKAILYSEDPAVTNNGGFYSITRESGFVKEFKEVAFSLDEGEVSEPFKTDFGFHIIKLEKIKGQQRDVRHILMQPKVSQDKLDKVKEKISQIRDSILAEELSFELAVKKYSEDKDTRQNKGIIINPQTNDSRFELTRMDPSFYGRVSNLALKDVSEPFYEETREGEKMYKIILMKDKVEGHKADFVKDYVKIQQLTLQKKQEDVINKWYAKHVLDTYVKINENNQKCAFKYNWSKS
ncbi:peptidylprolyl isomerase [Flavicella sediminum]|uniref:peptidylprolyl isomerase n=1 Tax=Flavicella sediminum TaxID=2585141 RepID=UPI001120C4D1|nr:peptidylprolyl isomerase [Flavicella sediminum]